jgi:hypothetical protein
MAYARPENQQITLHVTPASCSFTSVRQLTAAIGAFTGGWNDHPQPFAWTKDADEILASIKRAKTKPRSLQITSDACACPLEWRKLRRECGAESKLPVGAPAACFTVDWFGEMRTWHACGHYEPDDGGHLRALHSGRRGSVQQ